jgi:hypothetical protein
MILGKRSNPSLIQTLDLTRGEHVQAAADRFVAILQEGKLRGGAGCIKGGFRCVCFSEAPVSKLSYILATPGAHPMRYKPFGIMVSKSWLFERGGRPVIYQPEVDFDLLHDDQKFRHVRYELNTSAPVDFTWEREWRIRIDDLPIDQGQATAVVPSRAWEEWFQARHMGNVSNRALLTSGLIGPSEVTRQPWHFIVLEDLGIPISAVGPPQT